MNISFLASDAQVAFQRRTNQFCTFFFAVAKVLIQNLRVRALPTTPCAQKCNQLFAFLLRVVGAHHPLGAPHSSWTAHAATLRGECCQRNAGNQTLRAERGTVVRLPQSSTQLCANQVDIVEIRLHIVRTNRANRRARQPLSMVSGDIFYVKPQTFSIF